MQIDRLLDTVVRTGASDLHLTVGRKPTLRLDGGLKNLDTKVLDGDDCVALMKQITPDLSTAERFWRTQFVLGSMAFTMSSIQSLTDILENKQGSKIHPEKLVDYLVPFLAAGLEAEPA